MDDLELPDEFGAEPRAAADEDRSSVHQTIALAVENYLAMRETAKVNADPDTLRALAEARESVREGNVVYGVDAVRRLLRGRPPGLHPDTSWRRRGQLVGRSPTSCPEVAAAAVEFIIGPLLTSPRRVGKPLERS